MGLLTFGNRKFEALDGTMRLAIEPLHTSMQQMIALVDKDTQAFTEYMASCGFCKSILIHLFVFPLFYYFIGCTSVTKEQHRRSNQVCSNKGQLKVG